LGKKWKAKLENIVFSKYPKLNVRKCLDAEENARERLDAEDFLNVHRYIYGKEIRPLLEKTGFKLKKMEKVTYPPCELCEEYDYDYFSEKDFWDWLVVAKKPRNGE
jgi:hypothetical protein